MGTDVNTTINCTDCGAKLPDGWVSSADRGPCPECGSQFKTIHLNIVERIGLQIRDWITGKMKDNNFNSKKNPRYEFFEGSDLRKSDGKWMNKSRVIEKNNDKYMEKIVDPETGEVIHLCEEPLSEHFGHGSAKPKVDKDKNA